MNDSNDRIPACLRSMADCAENETGQRISEIFRVEAFYREEAEPPVPMWAYAVSGDARIVQAWLQRRGQTNAWAVGPDLCTVCRVVDSHPPIPEDCKRLRLVSADR
jgi:hypothetical protein